MKKLYVLLLFAFIGLSIFSQPSLQWVQNYNGPVSGADRITSMDNDAAGNIYVTGPSDSTLGIDYVTIKYSASGTVLWRMRYNGTANLEDYPEAIKYDPINNAVYVTGKSKGTGSGYDILTIRYNATTGKSDWIVRYNGTQNGDDEGVDIDVDATGNVYVVGSVLETYNNRLDVKTIKYNATNGNVFWTKSISSLSYDNNTNLANKIAVNGNKVVIIYSYTDIKGYDPTYYGVAEGYLISDGSITHLSYESPASIGEFTTLPFPITYGIAFDGLGNVYVCGGNQPSGYYSQIQVTKLSTDVNTVIWMQRTTGHEGNDWANNIIVDANYNAYITGYSDTLAGSLVNNNIITSKYNSTGNLVWAKTFDGIGDGDDKGFILARNNLSNPDIWVTGYTSQTNNKKSITTIKYDNNGNLLWSKDYNCGGNGDNYPTAMYRDPNDNIIIAGYNSCNGTDEDFLTLKYCSGCPNVIVSNPVTICSGSSTNLSASGAVTYSWSPTTGLTDPNIANPVASPTSTTTYTVTGSNNIGSGNATVVVTVKNSPNAAGTIIGTATVCIGLTGVIYSVPAITGATSYIWTLPTGAIGTSTKDSISVSFGNTAITGSIKVKGHNDCGDGIESTLAIIVNNLPEDAGSITGTTSLCIGSTNISYNVPAITGAASYIWTLPTGATGTSATNSISVNFGSTAVSGNIKVKGHNNCGDSKESTFAVTVNNVPNAAGSITGTATVCKGATGITYIVSAITGATSYIWTLPSGATGTSATNSISLSFGNSAVSGSIKVKGHNDCGDGAESTFSIIVGIPNAAGTISGTTLVCKGSTNISYSVPSITGATSYVWTLPTGASGTSSTSNISINYNSTAVSGNITVKGHNDCGDGAESTFAVTVNEIPATPVITLNKGILQSNATNGNQWYLNKNILSTAVNSTLVPVSNGDYYVIITLNACSSQPSNIISYNPTGIDETNSENEINVYPNPTTGIVKLILNNNFNSDYIIDIYDNVGGLLQTLKKSKSVVNFDLDLSGYSTGVYLIRIYTSVKNYQFKVVKK